ncbi:MAG: glycosyltransferase [Moorella sp. (in: firmicutes)]
MQLPRISLCMIIKNEAENLPRCLNSVQGIVDEIIIADTGSEDESINVAKKYQAKVFHYQWQGDFSAARNFSLEQATGDWILFLDADEELVRESATDIHEFLAKGTHEGYYVLETNYVGEKPGIEAVLHITPRIFRNKPEYRFTGAIHEQISSSIEKYGGSIGFSKVKINHYGYLNKAISDKKKTKRNLSILEHQIKEYPNDPFTHFNLGAEYMRIGNYEQALFHFKISFSNLPSLEIGYASVLVRNIAYCLRQLKRYKDALKVLEDAIMAFPDYTDLIFLKAGILADMKRFSQAASFYELCLKQGEANIRHATEQGVGSYKAWYALGQIYEQLLDPGRAVRAYTQALDANHHFLAPLDNLADILIPCEKLEDVQTFFDRHLDMKDEDTLIALAQAFARNNQYEVSLEYVKKGLSLFPGSQQFILLQGQYMLYLKRYQEARKIFNRIPPYSHLYPYAIMNTGYASFLMDDYQAALEVVKRLHELESDIPHLEAFEALIALFQGASSDRISLKHTEQNEKMVWFLLGELIKLEEYEKFEKALALTEIISAEKRSLQLGKLYFKYGFYDLAAEELIRAAKQGLADAEAFNLLGDICMKKKLYEDGEVFYRQALVMNNKLLRYYIALTNSLIQQQKLREAVAVLQDAISHFPESEILRTTLTTIRTVANE